MKQEGFRVAGFLGRAWLDAGSVLLPYLYYCFFSCRLDHCLGGLRDASCCWDWYFAEAGRRLRGMAALRKTISILAYLLSLTKCTFSNYERVRLEPERRIGAILYQGNNADASNGEQGPAHAPNDPRRLQSITPPPRPTVAIPSTLICLARSVRSRPRRAPARPSPPPNDVCRGRIRPGASAAVGRLLAPVWTRVPPIRVREQLVRCFVAVSRCAVHETVRSDFACATRYGHVG